MEKTLALQFAWDRRAADGYRFDDQVVHPTVRQRVSHFPGTHAVMSGAVYITTACGSYVQMVQRTGIHCLVAGCGERAVLRLDRGGWYRLPFCQMHRHDQTGLEIEEENRVPHRQMADFSDRPEQPVDLVAYLSLLPLCDLSLYCEAVLFYREQ